MSLFQIIYSLFLVGLLLWDWFFLKRNAGPSFKLFALLLIVGGTLSLFPQLLVEVSNRVGVGRAVDLAIYIILPVLIRELFVNRRRVKELKRQQTLLVRALAKNSLNFK